MKYVKVGKVKNMILIKDDSGKETWYDTSKAVKTYASSNFKEGDNIEITSAPQAGKALQFVSRVTKPGQTTLPPSTPPVAKFNCEICGKPLKDDKYKLCYECNKTKKSTSPVGLDEKSELIKREAVAHATSRAINALQGHVDPNNICSVIETIYKKFLDLVEGR